MSCCGCQFGITRNDPAMGSHIMTPWRLAHQAITARYVVELAGIALMYLVLAKSGLKLALINPSASPVSAGDRLCPRPGAAAGPSLAGSVHRGADRQRNNSRFPADISGHCLGQYARGTGWRPSDPGFGREPAVIPLRWRISAAMNHPRPRWGFQRCERAALLSLPPFG